MAKNIAAFVDGTWNEASAHIRNEDTNVWKLYKLAAETRRSTNQVVRYVRGVGTVRRKAARTLPRRAKPCSPRILARAVKNYPADIGTWVTRRAAEKYEALTGGILGRGCVDRIREAYSFLCKHYEPGDSVYLFGFSRGAFIARLVAEFTAQVGLLLRPYAVGPDKRNLVERACWLFLVDPAAEDDSLRRLLQQVTGTARPTDNSILPIYFIGAWDTVAAIHGSERVVLNGKDVLVDLRNKYKVARGLPVNVTHARHALALHELRGPFEPLLWSGCHPTPLRTQQMKQVWFPGAHSDVGGGYRETGLSRVALGWMTREALAAAHAASDPLVSASLAPAPEPFVSSAPHNEIQSDLSWRPSVRESLQDEARPGYKIPEYLYVHLSACQQLTSREATEYRDYPYYDARNPFNPQYPVDVKAELQEVDRLTVQLQLTLAYGQGKFPADRPPPLGPATDGTNVIPNSVAGTSATDVRDAHERLTGYFGGEGALPNEDLEEAIRALVLCVLFGAPEIAMDLEGNLSQRQRDALGSLASNPSSRSEIRNGLLARLRSLQAVTVQSQQRLPTVWAGAVGPLTAKVSELAETLSHELNLADLRDPPFPPPLPPWRR